jgi:hypothetical protein
MTNTQLMLSIGLPTLTILVGIFYSQKGIAVLSDRLDRIEGRLDRIDADLRQFFSITGRLEGRMDSFEKR